jgi:hypothetical protein
MNEHIIVKNLFLMLMVSKPIRLLLNRERLKWGETSLSKPCVGRNLEDAS